MPEFTIEYRDPRDLKVHPSSPQIAADDPYVAEFVEYYRSGLPFPGNLSPEALFSDFTMITPPEQEAVITKHCKDRGYQCLFGDSPRFGRLWHSIIKPNGLMDVKEAYRECQSKHTSKETSFVYLIVAEGTDRAKVGYARNPDERCKALQNGSPVKLSVAQRVEGKQADEKHLHKSLKRFHVHGEWFRLTADSREILDSFFGDE